MSQPSFLASLELILLQLIELHGLDGYSFMQEVGINSASIPDPMARTATQVADQFFEKAIAQIPDPAFALRAAECWHPSNLGAMGYAWLSSATLQAGMDRLARYSRILGQKSSWHCVKGANELRFVFDNRRTDSAVKYVMTDFSMSIVIDMCRENMGAGFHPKSVTMRRPEPANPKPYLDFFGCAVQFGADQDSFVLDQRLADTPLPSSNRELAITFDSILAEQLASLDKSDVLARCKAYLLQQMTSGEPTEQDLANALSMSLRTLQRKLADGGATYKTLLDELRHDLAQRYLASSQRSVTEITFLLGFSEQSAFTRAFKRWNGNTPTAYREQHAIPL